MLTTPKSLLTSSHVCGHVTRATWHLKEPGDRFITVQCVPKKRTTYFQMVVTQLRIVEVTRVGRVLERAGADLSNAYNNLSVTQI